VVWFGETGSSSLYSTGWGKCRRKTRWMDTRPHTGVFDCTVLQSVQIEKA